MNRVVVAAGIGLAFGLAACADKPKPPAAPTRASTPPVPQVCVDFSFPIYFETSSDRLNPAAVSVIRDAAQRVRGCTLGRIDVVGLADAGGSDRTNLVVSRRRAASVAAALAAAGLPRPTFDIDAAGASGAVAPDGSPVPLRRRTEVVIRASPPPPPAN
ncbi:MAG: hypothetical protein B7Y99_09110 [Caulobacterales bacterium 32-69-10]|nr:MAG: hypothetical protein B7Y99_09110 [Caulobacterales bacterium 32-69-10]